MLCLCITLCVALACAVVKRRGEAKEARCRDGRIRRGHGGAGYGQVHGWLAVIAIQLDTAGSLAARWLEARTNTGMAYCKAHCDSEGTSLQTLSDTR